jgi:hypothetical protein
MGLFAAGQVVIVRFPFSDFATSKLRPAPGLAVPISVLLYDVEVRDRPRRFSISQPRSLLFCQS